MTRPRAEVLWACGITVAVAALLVALLIVPDDPAKQPPLTPRVAVAESSTAKGFTIRAWLSSSRVYRGQTVLLRFLLENHTASTITGIKLADLQVPGFVPPVSAAWRTTPLDALPDLAPGQSESLETDLSPTIDSYGTFSPAALFRWTSVPPSPAKPEQTTLPIAVGPVEIVGPWKPVVSFGRRIYTLLKDLALPLALAVLAFLFQGWQKRNEESAAELHEASAKQEADQREMSERKLQVWKKQVKRLNYNSAHHYLPIIRSARKLRALLLDKKAAEYAKEDSHKIWEHLYWWLMLFARAQRLRIDGGLFFMDRGGEDVAYLTWWLLDWHARKRFTPIELDRALHLVSPTEDFDAFLRSARQDSLLRKGVESLRNWIEDGQVFEMAPLLEILMDVIDFETNRPFDVYWYETPDQFRVKAEYAIPSDPDEEDVKEKVRELTKALQAYHWATTGYIEDLLRNPRN